MSCNEFGKDAPLEQTIELFTKRLTELGLKLKFKDEQNPCPNLYSCTLFDENNPDIITSNGKGVTKEAAKCSALGEMAERVLNQSFFEDYYLGEDVANLPINRYHDEQWITYPESYNFKDLDKKEKLLQNPVSNLIEQMFDEYNSENESKLADIKSETYKNKILTPELTKLYNIDKLIPLTEACTGNYEKGICTIPLINEFTKKKANFPVHLLEHCYCSNGMCAGNSEHEAKVQGLSEIFERFVRKFLYGEINPSEIEDLVDYDDEEISRCLPTIPDELIKTKYPDIYKLLEEFNKHGYNIVCYDASLGGRFPVVAIAIYSQQTFEYKISLGSHPNMRIALERTITELMQGVNWDTIYLSKLTVNDLGPNINDEESDSNEFGMRNYYEMDSDIILNFIQNFIDDSGQINSTFFSNEPCFDFVDWSFESDNTKEQYEFLLSKLKEIDKELWCYDASYKELKAYRLVVPNFSEIYSYNDCSIHYAGFYRYVSPIRYFTNSKFTDEELAIFMQYVVTNQRNDINYTLGIVNTKSSPFYNLNRDAFLSFMDIAADPFINDDIDDFKKIMRNHKIDLSKVDFCKKVYLFNFFHNNKEVFDKDNEYIDSMLALFNNFVNKDNKVENSTSRIFPVIDKNLKGIKDQENLIKTYKTMLQKQIETH